MERGRTQESSRVPQPVAPSQPLDGRISLCGAHCRDCWPHYLALTFSPRPSVRHCGRAEVTGGSRASSPEGSQAVGFLVEAEAFSPPRP